MKQRVLIVEDDAALARVLRDNLRLEGFDVHHVDDGAVAMAEVERVHPDLVLLDLMLPGKDGFELCETLHHNHSTALIILTARGRKADRLRGLSLGADDYVTKPFDLAELIARIHAVLRRSSPSVTEVVLGSVVINFGSLQARRGRAIVELTHREFEILHYLAERQQRVVRRNELLTAVWGYSDLPYTRSVDHAIARLRKKVEHDPHHPTFIHTVHGDGYRLTPDSTTPAAGHGTSS